MSDVKTKLKLYDTDTMLEHELHEDYSRFKSLNLMVAKEVNSNTLIVDLPCIDGGCQTWRYLYITPPYLHRLHGVLLDQVDFDDCTTLSRDQEEWILTRMIWHES